MRYIGLSFRSLPSTIKKLIIQQNIIGFEEEIAKLKYSQATRISGRHHFSRCGNKHAEYEQFKKVSGL